MARGVVGRPYVGSCAIFAIIGTTGLRRTTDATERGLFALELVHTIEVVRDVGNPATYTFATFIETRSLNMSRSPTNIIRPKRTEANCS